MQLPADRSPDATFLDLVTSLVRNAADAAERERLARLLPRLEQLALERMEQPGTRAIARAQLAKALLVALGPEAAHQTLSRALADSDAITDADGRVRTLVEAATSAAGLGSLGADLLARIEGHAASLPPSTARARLLATLSVAYGKAKNPDKAAKLAVRAMNGAEKIESIRERIEALVTVAIVLDGSHASRQDAREALDRAATLANGMDDAAGRPLALLDVAAALVRVGRADEGMTTLRRAVGDEPPVAAEPEPADVAEEEPAALDEELEVLAEPAPEPAPRRAPAVRQNGHDDLAGAAADGEPSDVPEEFVDPVAGVKFPTFSNRRRRR